MILELITSEKQIKDLISYVTPLRIHYKRFFLLLGVIGAGFGKWFDYESN